MLVKVASEVAKNVLMGFPPVRDLRLRRTRTAESSPSPEHLFIYAYRLPQLTLKYFGDVRGKDIVEIGPGDHLAVGLTFLALGASSYTSLDRFTGQYSSPISKQWYRLTREHFADRFGIPWPQDLDPEAFPDSRVNVYATAVERPPSIQADIVCSHNVGEHVSDIRAFAESHKTMLRPGGLGIHVVDFSGHNWHLSDDDPFLFHRFPNLIWKAMGSNRGYPNRVPFREFTNMLNESGLHVTAAETKPFRKFLDVQEATYVVRLASAR